MSTVSSHIQRAINEAKSDQILPQIQATLKSGQGHMPERRWEDPARRPEYRSEEALDRRLRSQMSVRGFQTEMKPREYSRQFSLHTFKGSN